MAENVTPVVLEVKRVKSKLNFKNRKETYYGRECNTSST